MKKFYIIMFCLLFLVISLISLTSCIEQQSSEETASYTAITQA